MSLDRKKFSKNLSTQEKGFNTINGLEEEGLSPWENKVSCLKIPEETIDFEESSFVKEGFKQIGTIGADF